MYFPVLSHQYNVATEVQLYLLSGSSTMLVWGILEKPSLLIGMLLVGVAPGDNANARLPWVLVLCWPSLLAQLAAKLLPRTSGSYDEKLLLDFPSHEFTGCCPGGSLLIEDFD